MRRGVRASLTAGVTYHRLLLGATEAFLAEQPADDGDGDRGPSDGERS